MRFSLSWLREYAPLDAPVRDVVRALVAAGIEVEDTPDGPRWSV